MVVYYSNSLFLKKSVMKFNTITSSMLIVLIVGSLSGCASTSNFFRNRNFDYVCESCQQKKPLEVPQTVSLDPNIYPALIIPSVPAISFSSSNSQKKAQDALLPPDVSLSNYITTVE